MIKRCDKAKVGDLGDERSESRAAQFGHSLDGAKIRDALLSMLRSEAIPDWSNEDAATFCGKEHSPVTLTVLY